MYNTHTDIWIAGAFAAVVVDFVVYPVDTLKTRIQSANYEQRFKDARTGALKRNVLFRGLYQGVWSVVFSTIPSSGAFFTTYEAVKSTLYKSSASVRATKADSHSTPAFQHSLPIPIIHGIASSSAEAVSCLILTPAEVLKQNAQMISSENASSKSPAQREQKAMAQVLSRFKGKPWKLWSGYSALLGRNLPTTGIQFPLFEFVRSQMVEWRRRRRETKGVKRTGQREVLIERAGLTGLSAGMAGIVSSFVTTPIDVVKTRMMLSATDGSSGAVSASGRKKGTVEFGKEIFRTDGVRGLFKGGGIRAGWTAVALSLYLGIYEGGRLFLENQRMEREGHTERQENDQAV